MQKPEIVFFGSGPVAAQALEMLLGAFEVVAVVTKPKPPHHKGSFPVLEISRQHDLTVHTAGNKDELSALIAARPFEAEVAVLVDFGIIVGRDVIEYFPRGIINSHFSLLPEWRGADPITFAILSGQNKTGVSLMLLVEAMDEGPLLGCGVYELDGTETTPTLTDGLIKLSDSLLKEQLPRYLSGESRPIEQSEMAKLVPDYPDKPTYSRKITKQDGELDFTKPAQVLEREIRAYVDWPKSHTKLANIDVIITSVSVVNNRGEPGKVSVKDKQIIIFCGEEALLIKSLKPAGKKEMSGQAFLAGYKPNWVY